MPAGELAIVLHTHMPYVEGGGEWPPREIRELISSGGCDFTTAAAHAGCEPSVEGFGTWPFGEEWLWEAVATSYLPLLDVLERRGVGRSRRQLTLSLTPVLCDQLQAPGALERCLEFLLTVRPESHAIDAAVHRQGDAAVAAELERSARDYARAATRLQELISTPGGLLGALGAHATWTSTATHAVLPLLALRDSIVLQLGVGIESHRRRFGEWGAGLWLPECAHAWWVNALLTELGVRMTCVELTSIFGRGDQRNLHPHRLEQGPALFPVDREVVDLVWGPGGYPASGAYRDSHRRTAHDHHAWANDGQVYDRERAQAQARADAASFVSAVSDRLSGGGLCVCALDTELLGHWWYEGPLWLEAVLEQADAAGLRLTALDEQLLERHPPVAGQLPRALPAISWGEGGDLRSWSGPEVADLAFQSRTAELHAHTGEHGELSPRAVRELLALQSSDWAFLAQRGWAGDYPRQRASWHAAQLAAAISDPEPAPGLRNLAPWLA